MSLATKLGNRFKIAFAAQVVGVCFSGALLVVLARLLGPEPYGLLSLAVSVLGIAKLFSAFGIAKSASRYIADYKETNSKQIPHILQISLLLNIGAITIVVFVLVVGHNFFAEVMGEPELAPFLLVGGAFVAFDTLYSYAKYCIQGFEEIAIASKIGIFRKVGRFCIVVLIVIAGFEALGAFIGYIISYGLVAVIGLGYLYNKYQTYNKEDVEPRLRKRILTYSFPIAVTQSAHAVDNYIDAILVGFFLGPAAVGYYSIGKQVIGFIETPMTALGFSLSPTYGSQKAQDNTETVAQIYEIAVAYGLLLYIPAAAGLAILAKPGIELVFGPDYSEAVPVLQVLSLFLILKSITKLTSEGLDYLGRARDRAVIRGVTAILNALLNVALISVYGVVGAAIATVLTFSCYTIANMYIMHLELHLRVWWLLRRFTVTCVITGIMSILVYWVTTWDMGVMTLFVAVPLGIFVWALLVLFLGLIDRDQVVTILSS